MFEPEENAWTKHMNYVHHFIVPGLSPLHPQVHCTADFEVCHFTTGEGEINAANSMMSILLNPKFYLRDTFWLLNGIGGGTPTQVTTGSVTFAKYAVQVGLQYQIDPKELGDYPDWPTGYFSYGAKDPWGYPDSVYGTEVFELNEKLRDRAIAAGKKVEDTLDIGNEENIALRAKFPAPGNSQPFVKGCDVLTSDNYWIGETFDNYFIEYSKLITNGSAIYCSAAQEENATLEAILRLSKFGYVNYGRVIVMRAISNFVKAPEGFNDPVDFFHNYPKGGIELSLNNLYKVGIEVVKDILENYEEVCELKAGNYLGDIFGTLGGVRDFGKDKYTVH